MLKRDELTDPNSCLNKAQDDEPVFVLLGRDPSAPDKIREWAHDRIDKGSNIYGDAKIQEAYKIAADMERFREKFVKEFRRTHGV